MSLKSPDELVQEAIAHSETCDGLVPESSADHVNRILAGEIGPEDSTYPFVVATFVRDSPVVVGPDLVKNPAVPRLVLGDPPPDPVHRAGYAREYAGLVGAMQDIHGAKPQVKLDLETAAVEEARAKMLANNSQLLGGVAITLSRSANQVMSNLFMAKPLVEAYGGLLRDVALSIDVDTLPEDQRTERNITDIFNLKQMRAEELIKLSAGTVVAAMMPTPDDLRDLFGS